MCLGGGGERSPKHDTYFFTSGNVAFRKTAWQSSVYDPHGTHRSASNAVNGKMSDHGIWEHRQCAQTQRAGQSWWMVDLEHLYTVHNVSIVAPFNCE